MKKWLEDKHTIGELVNTVLKIDNATDAKSFYDWSVDWVQRQIDAGTWKSDYNAVNATRANIGWCYGEGMSKDRIAMWVEACNASHPVFGQVLPSPQEAIDSGKRLGAQR